MPKKHFVVSLNAEEREQLELVVSRGKGVAHSRFAALFVEHRERPRFGLEQFDELGPGTTQHRCGGFRVVSVRGEHIERLGQERASRAQRRPSTNSLIE